MTYVHEIVYMNNIESLKVALRRGKADVNAMQSGSRATALMLAGWRGHETCARLLIEHGADVNIQNENGDSAMFWAIQRGHAGLVQLLADNGADFEQKNKNGQTPIEYATAKGQVVIARILQEAQEASVVWKQRRINERARKMKKQGGPA
jgi:ankyrin repeat protein